MIDCCCPLPSRSGEAPLRTLSLFGSPFVNLEATLQQLYRNIDDVPTSSAMATILESLFPAMREGPIPQRRRPHDSIEVIDVDELDDEEIAALQRPLQRRRIQPPQEHIETISLLDSDEDEPQIVASTSTSQTGGE